jgi:hypothetical protein
MAQFKFKRASGQVGLRCCCGCQFFPSTQLLLNALNSLRQQLGLCERTRVVSTGLGSPWVGFSTHFAFLSGTNVPGSIAGSPQALSQSAQLFSRSLFDSRRMCRVHNLQLRGAEKPCFQLCLVAHWVLQIAAERSAPRSIRRPPSTELQTSWASVRFAPCQATSDLERLSPRFGAAPLARRCHRRRRIPREAKPCRATSAHWRAFIFPSR